MNNSSNRNEQPTSSGYSAHAPRSHRKLSTAIPSNSSLLNTLPLLPPSRASPLLVPWELTLTSLVAEEGRARKRLLTSSSVMSSSDTSGLGAEASVPALMVRSTICKMGHIGSSFLPFLLKFSTPFYEVRFFRSVSCRLPFTSQP
jgi:hypothetical protein